MRSIAAAIVFSGALVAGSVFATGFVIGESESGNQYTGCLTKLGQITRVAIGSEPLRPCRNMQTQISWNQTGPQVAPGPPGPEATTTTLPADRPVTVTIQVFTKDDPQGSDYPVSVWVECRDRLLNRTDVPYQVFDSSAGPAGGPAVGVSFDLRSDLQTGCSAGVSPTPSGAPWWSLLTDATKTINGTEFNPGGPVPVISAR
jgi:hypothetical protein